MDPQLQQLGDVELLASLLGGDALPLAGLLVQQFEGLHGLASAETAEIAMLPGVGRARAVRVRAALELGRRALVGPQHGRAPVDTAAEAHRWLGPALSGLAHEELHGLYIDRRRRPLAVRRLSRGSDQYTVVDPRQIFRPAVRLGAAGVVLAHNHPSGDSTPSHQDREVTRRVAAAGRVLGVELLDHLVVGAPGYQSMRERGELEVAAPMAAAWTS